MEFLSAFKKFWNFLKKDSWGSWAVSIILAFVIIRFVFFPLLSFVTASPLPLVVVESCSMYHESDFDEWWDRNAAWYEEMGIFKEAFSDFPFSNGLNKGDIILVSGRGNYELGDIIIFEGGFRNPLIHRIVEISPELGTKGDHNPVQLVGERAIAENSVLGKSVLRIPALGWVKLVFFEGFRPPNERGFCR